MKLSIVIPASNEEGSLGSTIRDLSMRLIEEGIDHELIVINDGSTDGTERLLRQLEQEITCLRSYDNPPPNGFGFAVRKGLQHFSGDTVAIFMADGSDSAKDLVCFFRTMVEKKVDCVFGTRFSTESKVVDYPLPKLVLNRLINTAIRLLFGIRYNDVTNAFKLYRKEVIQGLGPLLSHHFNLTVELPLKAIVRGYTYAVVPNSWVNRKQGESKLKIKEMGSRYVFIILYCFIEKWLSRGDYRRVAAPVKESGDRETNPTTAPHLP